MPVKLPPTAGARPDQMNITFSPSSSNCLRLPERKPSPKPTRSSKEPTPQAMPNMVRKDRSLCAHSVRRVWLEISKSRRISSYNNTRGRKAQFQRTTQLCLVEVPSEERVKVCKSVLGGFKL